MLDPIQPSNLDVERQAYAKPAILHELALETRAGSPLRIDPMIDPLGLDPITSK